MTVAVAGLMPTAKPTWQAVWLALSSGKLRHSIVAFSLYSIKFS